MKQFHNIGITWQGKKMQFSHDFYVDESKVSPRTWWYYPNDWLVIVEKQPLKIWMIFLPLLVWLLVPSTWHNLDIVEQEKYHVENEQIPKAINSTCNCNKLISVERMEIMKLLENTMWRHLHWTVAITFYTKAMAAFYHLSCSFQSIKSLQRLDWT